MNRLFTFGCSFTQYWRWPTWADILGKQFDSFENWGICGSGNQLIFHSLIECHARQHIQSKDTVIVMWTNTTREDRYVKDHWITPGNIFWQDTYNKNFVKEFSCERGYLIKDLSLISATAELLDKWECNWHFLSMVPLAKHSHTVIMGPDFESRIPVVDDIVQIYQSTLDQIKPSMFEIIFNNNWNSRVGIQHNGRRDFHPTPTEHLEYLEKVLPEFSIADQTKRWTGVCEEDVKNTQKCTWNPHLPTRF